MKQPTKKQIIKAFEQLIKKYKDGIKEGVVQISVCAMCTLFDDCLICTINYKNELSGCLDRPSYKNIRYKYLDYMILQTEENKIKLAKSYQTRINQLKKQLQKIKDSK